MYYAKFRFTLLFLLTLLLAFSITAAFAQENQDGAVAGSRVGSTPDALLPSAFFDPDETSWTSVRNHTSDQFAAFFQVMKNNNIILDIEIDEINGQQRVGSAWQTNSDNRGWAEYRNLNSDQFHDKWQELADDGYRLIDQESYVLSGQRYYAGIWVENVEGYGWASFRNMTSEQFADSFEQYSSSGYIMIDFEAYPTGGGVRYAAAWVKNVENLSWIERRDLTDEQFSDLFNQYKNNYRILDIESYERNGAQNYAAIWVENKNGRGWAELRDMSEKSYRNYWYRYRDLGYRLIDYEIYPYGSGYRYAAVWRQNSDRPDWSLKSAVDQLANDQLNQYNVPGIGIAIVQDGEFKYRRGFGYQDINDNIWYSSATRNPLASVSKPIGAVLTMKLVEDGLLELDEPTASYINQLPAHQTHTIRQLLSMRGGVGHYPELGSVNAQYNTALAGAQFFWDKPLLYTPGSSCYYSTHGYTLLGAAIEGATGKSIGQLIADEVAAPYQLASLQVVNHAVPDEHRATLYDSNNDEIVPDNSSWKVLGGGLQASPYDLARWGHYVINGSIINAAALQEMWTVPQPTPCIASNGDNLSNYALGWGTGTELGTQVVDHTGSWFGYSTYIRMYPEEDIVIVVLSNRRPGRNDFTPWGLGSQIGSLLITEILENKPVYDVALPVILR